MPKDVITNYDDVDEQTGKPVVYLTVDDGPSGYTGELLKILDENEASATFFLIGRQVRPDVLSKIVEHNSVGNHTWDHVVLPGVSSSRFADQVKRTDAVLGTSSCLRPPTGATDALTHRRIVDSGHAEVLWSVDTRDWSRPGTETIERRVLAARPGQIVLVHDGGGDRSQTIAALRRGLPKIIERGWVVRGLPFC